MKSVVLRGLFAAAFIWGVSGAAHVAHAADFADVNRAEKFEVGFGASLLSFQEDDEDNHFMLNSRVLFNINEHVAVGGELGWTHQSRNLSGRNYDLDGFPIFASTRLRYPNETGFTPYVIAGLGTIIWRADHNFADVALRGDRGFAGKLGVGCDVMVSEHMAFGVEAAYTLSNAEIESTQGPFRQEEETDFWTVGATMTYLY